jgi:hypothetical protein
MKKEPDRLSNKNVINLPSYFQKPDESPLNRELFWALQIEFKKKRVTEKNLGWATVGT